MINKIYQQIILDYSRDKSNKKEISANYIERGHNPNCGDDITILVKEENGIFKDVSFLGEGCAISTASTNILISMIKGEKIEKIDEIINEFFEMMRKENIEENEYDNLNDAKLLHLTHNMPARIKCATLPWHSIKIIIEKIKGE